MARGARAALGLLLLLAAGAGCASPARCRLGDASLTLCVERTTADNRERTALALWCGQQRGIYSEGASCDRASSVGRCEGASVTAVAGSVFDAGSAVSGDGGPDADAADAGLPRPATVPITVVYTGDLAAARAECASRGGSFSP